MLWLWPLSRRSVHLSLGTLAEGPSYSPCAPSPPQGMPHGLVCTHTVGGDTRALRSEQPRQPSPLHACVQCPTC